MHHRQPHEAGGFEQEGSLVQGSACPVVESVGVDTLDMSMSLKDWQESCDFSICLLYSSRSWRVLLVDNAVTKSRS